MLRKLLAVLSLFIVAVIGVSVWALWPRDADEISPQDAVADFHARESTTTSQATADPGDPDRSTPEVGVYHYDASGTEKTKFGPLPEQTNELPSTVTGTVTAKTDGCFEFRLNLFEQHTEDSRFCTDDEGFDLVTYAKHQTIGVVTATAKITCDPGRLIGSGTKTEDLECGLRLEGGPFPVEADFTGTSTVGPAETVTVDGTAVETTPVEVDFTFSGKVEGSWTEKIWFTDDRLPVRIERSLDMDGSASFDEQFDLTLSSLTPTT